MEFPFMDGTISETPAAALFRIICTQLSHIYHGHLHDQAKPAMLLRDCKIFEGGPSPGTTPSEVKLENTEDRAFLSVAQ